MKSEAARLILITVMIALALCAVLTVVTLFRGFMAKVPSGVSDATYLQMVEHSNETI